MNDPLFQELADPFYTIDLEIIKWFSRIWMCSRKSTTIISLEKLEIMCSMNAIMAVRFTIISWTQFHPEATQIPMVLSPSTKPIKLEQWKGKRKFETCWKTFRRR
jgi:hypothetical protein